MPLSAYDQFAILVGSLVVGGPGGNTASPIITALDLSNTADIGLVTSLTIVAASDLNVAGSIRFLNAPDIINPEGTIEDTGLTGPDPLVEVISSVPATIAAYMALSAGAAPLVSGQHDTTIPIPDGVSYCAGDFSVEDCIFEFTGAGNSILLVDGNLTLSDCSFASTPAGLIVVITGNGQVEFDGSGVAPGIWLFGGNFLSGADGLDFRNSRLIGTATSVLTLYFAFTLESPAGSGPVNPWMPVQITFRGVKLVPVGGKEPVCCEVEECKPVKRAV